MVETLLLEAGDPSLAMTFMTRPGHALTWFARYLIATPVKFPFPAFSPPLPSLSLTIHYRKSLRNTEMEKSQAEDYLTSLLNKTLRVTTTDTRMFLGQFKCTDSVRVSLCKPANIPASLSQPVHSSLSLSRLKQRHSRNRADAHQDRNIILSQTFEYRLPAPPKQIAGGEEKVTMEMTSRYMGLVVVPGEYIERIEVEEFESQMKGKMGVAMAGEKGEEEEEV
jgi:hypothetical protein